MKKKIKNALISVSDKSELGSIIKALNKYKVNIISSGGTFKFIKKIGLRCKEVSEFTNFKEMLDGRVKTLHPKIHSGILFDRSKKKHLLEMKNENFEPIDLVIINFYPFKEILKKTIIEKKIIENIDIGGPTIARAAAKNFKDVVVMTDTDDYFHLAKELKRYNGKTSLEFRKQMANKAFNLTAFYDAIIAEWFNQKLGIKFPKRKTFFGEKVEKLRYGENPHQNSSLYLSDSNQDNLSLKKINGKDLSYNNYNDIFSALEILYSEKKMPTTVIVKHANPCGVASNKSAFLSFKNSQASDPISAFGGIVACNFKINLKIALEIYKTFFEVIIAKGFSKDALKILKKKKNMRLIDISNIKDKNNLSTKVFNNSFLLQDKDTTVFNKKDLKFVTKAKPTSAELKEIEFAYRVCKFVKSNAIVIVKEHSTIGIGAGQQNRLDSCKIATQKAKQFQPKKLLNSIAASDAFFPFSDGIKNLINSGVKTIVQPGGSIRDKEVIEAANKAKIKMIFTGTRHFNH
tara:strand:+ start:1589 stop:3139 length:1551 start_codon:yes stop_codon:yes gene_type:complete